MFETAEGVNVPRTSPLLNVASVTMRQGRIFGMDGSDMSHQYSAVIELSPPTISLN